MKAYMGIHSVWMLVYMYMIACNNSDTTCILHVYTCTYIHVHVHVHVPVHAYMYMYITLCFLTCVDFIQYPCSLKPAINLLSTLHMYNVVCAIIMQFFVAHSQHALDTLLMNMI